MFSVVGIYDVNKTFETEQEAVAYSQENAYSKAIIVEIKQVLKKVEPPVVYETTTLEALKKDCGC